MKYLKLFRKLELKILQISEDAAQYADETCTQELCFTVSKREYILKLSVEIYNLVKDESVNFTSYNSKVGFVSIKPVSQIPICIYASEQINKEYNGEYLYRD